MIGAMMASLAQAMIEAGPPAPLGQGSGLCANCATRPRRIRSKLERIFTSQIHLYGILCDTCYQQEANPMTGDEGNRQTPSASAPLCVHCAALPRRVKRQIEVMPPIPVYGILCDTCYQQEKDPLSGDSDNLQPPSAIAGTQQAVLPLDAFLESRKNATGKRPSWGSYARAILKEKRENDPDDRLSDDETQPIASRQGKSFSLEDARMVELAYKRGLVVDAPVTTYGAYEAGLAQIQLPNPGEEDNGAPTGGVMVENDPDNISDDADRISDDDETQPIAPRRGKIFSPEANREMERKINLAWQRGLVTVVGF